MYADACRRLRAPTLDRNVGPSYSMNDVEVKPSLIQELGIFAARSFRAGERIKRVNVVREVTADTPIREDLGERTDHCAYPDGKVVLLGFPDRHVNHSCDPNAYELFEGDSSWIVARRDISPGDEITLEKKQSHHGCRLCARHVAWLCGFCFDLPESRSGLDSEH